jgi:aminopeptidase-like protein
MAKPQWKSALERIWYTNRAHVGREMSQAYRDLCEHYENCEIIGFATGDNSGGWEVPPGWEIQSARLLDPEGQVVFDREKDHPLGLFTYSPSFQGEISLEQLQSHLFSIPKYPERVGYHFRNQYRFWEPTWGFSLSHSQRQALKPGNYQVEIKTKFTEDKMEMVEQTHKGDSDESILLIGHFDHPYMCNDGLVGCLAGHEIVNNLKGRKTRFTYRMLSTVEIVGSVFYANRLAHDKKVKEGLFVATSGADAPLVYQKSSLGLSFIDRVFAHLSSFSPESYSTAEFRQGGLGNDEIAFDVHGVNIPCSSIMRAPFDQYHTHIDTPEYVLEDKFESMVNLVNMVIDVIEQDALLIPNFKGLPCLSRPEIDLYLPSPSMSHTKDTTPSKSDEIIEKLPTAMKQHMLKEIGVFNRLMTMMPILCNGENTVLDIAERLGIPFFAVKEYADMWESKGLLQKQYLALSESQERLKKRNFKV